MMIPFDLIVLLVAGGGACCAYAIAESVFARVSLFRSPKLIAFVVALLTFLGMMTLGRLVIYMLLLAFAALGFGLLALYVICCLAARSAGLKPPSLPTYLQLLKKIGGASAQRFHERKSKLGGHNEWISKI